MMVMFKWLTITECVPIHESFSTAREKNSSREINERNFREDPTKLNFRVNFSTLRSINLSFLVFPLNEAKQVAEEFLRVFRYFLSTQWRMQTKVLRWSKKENYFQCQENVFYRVTCFNRFFIFFGSFSRQRWVICIRCLKAVINYARSVFTRKFVGQHVVKDVSGDIKQLVRFRVELKWKIFAEIIKSMALDGVTTLQHQRQVSTVIRSTNLLEVGRRHRIYHRTKITTTMWLR